jgi:transposase-like protein
VADGVTRNGIKRILAFRVVQRESAPAWRNFLWSPYRRGLEGQRLKLITTDGCGGLIAAVQEVDPFVPRPRCGFHKRPNVATKVRRQERAWMLRGLRPGYQAPNRRAAERAALAWAAVWRDRCPDAGACVAQDLPTLRAVYDVPDARRRMVRTTNPLERRFREVRRRTDSMGTFVNEARIARSVYGLVAYSNAKYATRVCKEFRKARRVACDALLDPGQLHTGIDVTSAAVW